VLIVVVETPRAKAMANNGYSQSDIASALGVSTTTINTALKV
jgi:DNA-binding XRE family transcriptional regulator